MHLAEEHCFGCALVTADKFGHPTSYKGVTSKFKGIVQVTSQLNVCWGTNKIKC